jgi:hypothetical protein
LKCIGVVLYSMNSNAVWILRKKQVSSSVRYWLSIAGYDSRDRSLLTQIYLLYLVAFFSVWVLAVVFLVSNFIVNTLAPLIEALGITLSAFIISLATLLLFLWASYTLYRASKISPIVFSEDDAYILCQTPVNRRSVTFAWLFSQWPNSALPILAGIFTLAIALLEFDASTGMNILSLGSLVISALKPLSVIMPLHLGLFSAIWVVGVLRLRQDTRTVTLVKFVRVLVLILAVGLTVVLLGSLVTPTSPGLIQQGFLLLRFPMEVAFFQDRWSLGLTISFVFMVTTLAILWLISDGLNLSMAAQETRKSQARVSAMKMGDFDRAREISDLDRLGAMHTPSRILRLHPRWLLVWKAGVQSMRNLTASRLWPWLLLLLVTIPLALPLNGSDLLWVAIYWTLLVGQKTTGKLRDELGYWWLVDSLPLPAKRIVLQNLVLPISGVISITWIAMWVGDLIGLSPSPIMLCAVPFTVVGISLSIAYDLLRHANVNLLMDGRRPDFGPVGLILALLCLAVPFGLNYVIEHFRLPLAVGLLAVVAIGAVLAGSLLRICGRQLALID